MSGGPVLCAFDATEPSLLAAYAAADLAEHLQSELELVYVVDHDDLPALPPHPILLHGQIQTHDSNRQRYSDHVRTAKEHCAL